jgi:hypothetical protein
MSNLRKTWRPKISWINKIPSNSKLENKQNKKFRIKKGSS